MSRIIELSGGHSTIVDDDDYDRLAEFKWSASTSQCGKVYASRAVIVGGVRTQVKMHREIMGAPEGVEVDHRDGNGLNNRRRSNLRLATGSQNRVNRTRVNATGFRGVYKNGSRWRAEATMAGRVVRAGTFPTAREAATAYDTLARSLHGGFAVLNFPATVPA